MNALEESREQIAKAEQRLKSLELQVAHYRSLRDQEETMASKINDRILDIAASLEGLEGQRHRIQERVLSCIESEDENGALAGKEELAKLTSDSRRLVDQQIAMKEMMEAAVREAGSLELQQEKVDNAYWKLYEDLRALRYQYRRMGGNLGG
ncbi:hypothetical protein FRC01_007465 [Tulasnella sp. 417]|nr:hypothetical protein FRC01_007465 [Tulasnella sp. 417]